jgi:uncharacterized protein (DUF433 family)
MGAEDKKIELRKSAGGKTAYVGASRIRVSDVVRLYHVTQEELILDRMQRSLPMLSTDQLEAALAYWRSHKSEIEREILEEERLTEDLPPAW